MRHEISRAEAEAIRKAQARASMRDTQAELERIVVARHLDKQEIRARGECDVLAGGSPISSFDRRLGWVDYVVRSESGDLVGYIVRFWAGGSAFYQPRQVNPAHCRDISGDLRTDPRTLNQAVAKMAAELAA